jgi:AbrB family looped-hinge helix DNA binding protein
MYLKTTSLYYHIPKEIREATGIAEGDRVKMKVVEGYKIMIEKAEKEVWRDCTDFLSEDFEKKLASLRSDSTIAVLDDTCGNLIQITQMVYSW